MGSLFYDILEIQALLASRPNMWNEPFIATDIFRLKRLVTHVDKHRTSPVAKNMLRFITYIPRTL